MLAPGHRARAHTFDGLAPQVVERARTHARFITVRRGGALTRQGDPARRLLVIKDSYGKLVLTFPSGTAVIVTQRLTRNRDVEFIAS